MSLVGDVFAEVGRRLAGIGVQPSYEWGLSVPGERGDAIFIDAQRMQSGLPDVEEFMVVLTHHLVPWTAFQLDISPDEARTEEPDTFQAVFNARLVSPFSSFLPELWAVTPDTRVQVADGLTNGLGEALTETWLPILPRADLRALIRDPDRRGPSPLSNPQFIDLMCRIEETDLEELRELVGYFHTREADDPDLGRLAGWIEHYFLAEH